MNRHSLWSAGLVGLATILAVGCRFDALNNVGIDGTGTQGARDIVSIGRVQSLGAIVVNGVRYDTSSATVTSDGRVTTQSALDIGDIVVVEGKLDSTSTNATAQRVTADHILNGIIESIDITRNSLVALGQTIKLSRETVYNPPLSGISGLAVGNPVTVSGFRNLQGTIIATRIALQPAGDETFHTTGAVTGIAASGTRFSINNLIVDYATAALSPANAAGMLQHGVFVRVKAEVPPAGGVLAATSVEIMSDRLAGAGAKLAHIEGFITSQDAADPTQFKVNGLTVATSGTTQYAGSISTEAPVELVGSLDTAGIVLASNIGPGSGLPPQLIAASYVTVRGTVFDALSGPVSGASLYIWVQMPSGGYALSFAGVVPRTGPDGRFTAVVPSDALLVPIAQKSGFVQPCTTMGTATEGANFEVELVAKATLDAPNPSPPLSAAGATTVSGMIYEMVGGDRHPIAGASLWFGDSMGVTVAQTMSDRQGRYLACRMPNDPRWSDHWGTDLWASKEGYEDVVIERFDTSRSQVFDVELKRR